MGSGQKPHVIRLRGPWRTAGGDRVKLPATWADAFGDARQAKISRAFHCPTNLADGELVLLRVESPQQVEQILVNGSEMVDGSDLVGVMSEAEANRITVTLEKREADATLLEAHLEIRPL